MNVLRVCKTLGITACCAISILIFSSLKYNSTREKDEKRQIGTFYNTIADQKSVRPFDIQDQPWTDVHTCRRKIEQLNNVSVCKCKQFQYFECLQYFVLLRITNEGSVPEMRIWFILLIKSDFRMVYQSEKK